MSEENRKKRRLLRTFFLFLASLLVITVSASVYNLMYMQTSSPITAESAKVQFVTGTDSTAAGAFIGTNGTYVSFNSLAGWPNATRVYEDVVGIRNIDSSARTIELIFDSWSGSTENIDYIYVKVFDGSSQQGSTINVGQDGSSTGSLNIPTEATWRVQWEIKWKAGASTTDSVSVTLQLVVMGE